MASRSPACELRWSVQRVVNGAVGNQATVIPYNYKCLPVHIMNPTNLINLNSQWKLHSQLPQRKTAKDY